MKYYLISTDNLDQIQFIPHPKRDVNVKGKIVELTEEDIHTLWDSCQTAIYECSPGKEPPIQSVQGKIRKVLK